MAKFLYHLITDRTLYQCSPAQLAQAAEEAGVDYFQLREKDLSPARLLEMSLTIRPFLIRTKFIVNGQLDVAIAAGADGVHLQEGNLPIGAIRKAFTNLLIGYSAHSRQDLMFAEEEGADYAFLSPVFPPQSKRSSLPALGLNQAARWKTDVSIPVFALGGIEDRHLQSLQSAGFAGAAGISLFCDAGQFSRRRMLQ